MRPAAWLLQGDARAIPLADASVQCVVTSPPYWGLRSYGVPPAVWGGLDNCPHDWRVASRPGMSGGAGPASPLQSSKGTENFQEFAESEHATCAACGAWRGCLGLEPTPELYVEHLVACFREIRRVLRDDGTVWLNLGDSYAATHTGSLGRGERATNFNFAKSRLDAQGKGSRKEQTIPPGLKPKDLVGIPWRVAFALQADGWWLRSDIIWSKPNPMPESITDRPTKAHEYVFLLAKRATYFYDAEAVKEPNTDDMIRRAEAGYTRGANGKVDASRGDASTLRGEHAKPIVASGRNRRSVWTIATEPYAGAHFATFPEALVEPCILAGTSERGACPVCGAAWRRVVARGESSWERRKADGDPIRYGLNGSAAPLSRSLSDDADRAAGGFGQPAPITTTGWAPTCPHDAAPVPCRVLDPFSGSGTVASVAQRLGRVGLGVELKAEYLALARDRIGPQGVLL